ncbi:MAG: fatty acid desaturase [Elusimicrobia bacterium]|nr:fatty acid desaturase [Elusimicrobiota bacterium]
MVNVRTKELSLLNGGFLIVTPLVAVLGTGYYIYYSGVQGCDILNFFVFFALVLFSISIGYHRYFAHRSYRSGPLLRFLCLLFGAGAFQNSALRWASDHRNHHRYVDDPEKDPYSIMMGAFYAHMGWIFYKETPNKTFDNAPDLLKDPLVLWQDRHYILLSALVGFLLPLALGSLFGRPWGGLLWGGFLRIVIAHHVTFCVNSLAHMFGSQPYTKKNSSRDNWGVAFLTYGEGFHNYHHRFPGDYRNGIRWYHWDPSKWLLYVLSLTRMASKLNRIPDELILKARLEVEMQTVHERLQRISEEVRDGIRKSMRPLFPGEARRRGRLSVQQVQSL